MARTHLRVAARPDVWSELVAYVITAETATTTVPSWRADGLSPTRGLPAPRMGIRVITGQRQVRGDNTHVRRHIRGRGTRAVLIRRCRRSVQQFLGSRLVCRPRR